MEYDKFKKEYDKFTNWQTPAEFFELNSAYMSNPLKGADSEDSIQAAQPVDMFESKDVISFSDYQKGDAVNSPAHYTRGTQEAIDIIEEAIQDAPSVQLGMLQAQVLKYLLRMWLKNNPLEDAKKARWYLDRLIEKGNSAR